MKKIILFVVFAVFITTNSFSRGKIPVCFPCEKIDLVKDLPDDELLKQGTSYLNLGYYYEEYGIIFIPAWLSSKKYVLMNTGGSTYYDLTKEQITELETKYDLDLTSNPLSFWKKIGGKLIYIVVIGFLIWGQFSKDPEDENEEQTTPKVDE